MSDDDDLFEFVRGSVRSVWSLELLLLMRRTRERAWSPDELARELRANAPLATQVLAAFAAAGVAGEDADGRFAYRPATAALEALIDRLEGLYRERPVRVINLIVGLSTQTVQSFADAFRLRGDK